MHPQRRSNLIRSLRHAQLARRTPQRLRPRATGRGSEDPLPPLVEPASQEHHVGKVIFAELVTPDLAAAKQFYGGLFGWTFSDIQSGKAEYAVASLEDHPVAGLIHKEFSSAKRGQPAWLSFIAVRDVDATKNIAVQHGARVLFAPHSIPDRGRQAVLADPQGAVLCGPCLQ